VRRSPSWSSAEVAATVADYVAMFKAELAGAPYSKADHRRRLIGKLDNRSESAVERKHMNISAILREAGLPFIDGYKPLANYQESLRDAVLEVFALDRQLEELIERRLGATPASAPTPAAMGEALFEDPPEPEALAESVAGRKRQPVGRHFDYLEREAANRELGTLGEEFVFNLERIRLRAVGLRDLSNRVEWTARDRGDGFGYDISSYDESRRPLLIEVKTTNFQKRHPFLVTQNELLVSRERAMEYRVYRVFDFSNRPRCFVLTGAIDTSCRLAPTLYRASPGR